MKVRNALIAAATFAILALGSGGAVLGALLKRPIW